jgi:hypothetical protein
MREQVMGRPVHVPAQHQPGHVTRAKVERTGICAPGLHRSRARKAVHLASATMDPPSPAWLDWCPGSTRDPLPGPMRQACVARIAVTLTQTLHPRSGRSAGHGGHPASRRLALLGNECRFRRQGPPGRRPALVAG